MHQAKGTATAGVDDRPFAGQVAVVTGGAKRLGRVTCRRLAAVGAAVAVHHHTSTVEALSLVEQLRSMGVRAESFAADLDNAVERDALLGKVHKAFGQPASILVNNASSFPESRLEDLRLDALEASMRTNAWAPFDLTRSFAAQVADSPAGRSAGAVVNLLDTRITDADWSHVGYHLAKRTLLDFTLLSAVTYAPRITVNAVAPGAVLPPEGTDRQGIMAKAAAAAPLHRNASPDDIADAVLYLLGARAVTGQVLFVDGGRHLKHGH